MNTVKNEGIIPAIESAMQLPMQRNWPDYGKSQIIVINISGRGDKDCAAIARYRGRIFMTKIRDAFKDGKAFIPFLTCGDRIWRLLKNWYALWQAGADLIELGSRFLIRQQKDL